MLTFFLIFIVRLQLERGMIDILNQVVDEAYTHYALFCHSF